MALPKWLRKLGLQELSLVDTPANQHAHSVLHKRAGDPDGVAFDEHGNILEKNVQHAPAGSPNGGQFVSGGGGGGSPHARWEDKSTGAHNASARANAKGGEDAHTHAGTLHREAAAIAHTPELRAAHEALAAHHEAQAKAVAAPDPRTLSKTANDKTGVANTAHAAYDKIRMDKSDKPDVLHHLDTLMAANHAARRAHLNAAAAHTAAAEAFGGISPKFGRHMAVAAAHRQHAAILNNHAGEQRERYAAEEQRQDRAIGTYGSNARIMGGEPKTTHFHNTRKMVWETAVPDEPVTKSDDEDEADEPPDLPNEGEGTAIDKAAQTYESAAASSELYRATSNLESSIRSILEDPTVMDKVSAVDLSIGQFRTDMLVRAATITTLKSVTPTETDMTELEKAQARTAQLEQQLIDKGITPVAGTTPAASGATDDVLKGLSGPAREAVEKALKQANDAADVVAKMVERDRVREITEVAKSITGLQSGEAVDSVVEILKSVPAGTREKTEAVLKGAYAMQRDSNLMRNIGKQASGVTGEGSVEDAVNKAAQEKMDKDNTLTHEQAVSKVYRENPELYTLHQEELDAS